MRRVRTLFYLIRYRETLLEVLICARIRQFHVAQKLLSTETGVTVFPQILQKSRKLQQSLYGIRIKNRKNPSLEVTTNKNTLKNTHMYEMR